MSAKELKIILIAILTISCTLLAFIHLQLSVVNTSSVSVTATTDKYVYYLRQKVNVSGCLLKDGSPVSDALVAVEVRNSRGDPFIYRTILMGNPSGKWSPEITNALMTDFNGNPTNSVTIKSTARLYVTLSNALLNEVYTVVTITVYDGNIIPIFAGWHSISIPANTVQTVSWSVYIPEWAYPGMATAYFNVYSDFPQNGGTPLVPEGSICFYITRSPDLKYPYSPAKTTCASQPGQYETYFKVPPDRYTLPGTYHVYATVALDPVTKAYAETSFNVQSYPCPPQASFTYSPLKIYQNMTVTFDASSSSAEGYNDTIICYEWKINDPYNPQQIINAGNYTNPPSPLTYHAFQYAGTYTVELNVTDNEGLWSTTSKPVTILPEYGPTANFTWTPTTPVINQTVTFDASSCQPGWSAKIADYSPIVNYIWNFSDGTTATTQSTTIDHNFTQPGNFSVQLEIVDSVGRTDITQKTIQVLNITAKMYDLNNDGKIDMKDIIIAARAFGSKPGDPNWNPIADVNSDGVVDMKDIIPIARNFGKDP
jgi:PKD repeat protein